MNFLSIFQLTTSSIFLAVYTNLSVLLFSTFRNTCGKCFWCRKPLVEAIPCVKYLQKSSFQNFEVCLFLRFHLSSIVLIASGIHISKIHAFPAFQKVFYITDSLSSTEDLQKVSSLKIFNLDSFSEFKPLQFFSYTSNTSVTLCSMCESLPEGSPSAEGLQKSFLQNIVFFLFFKFNLCLISIRR